MKPAIYHVITTLDLGGAEKQLLTLAKQQIYRGHSVKVISLKGDSLLAPEFTKVGVTVDSSLINHSFGKQIRILRRIWRQSINVVFHAHLPRSELLCALSLPRNCFVVSRHNAEKFFPKSTDFFSRKLSQYVLSKSFACISISQAVQRFLEDISELPKAKNKRVIYYGLFVDEMQPLPKPDKSEHGLNIGTVARLVPQKNISLLLKTISVLAHNLGVDLKLNILGKGPLKESLQLECLDLGIQSIVEWYEPRVDVTSFYRQQDIFILTSNYEGFGLVLLEAMRLQIPIVARRVASIPEVLGDKHPGLVDSIEPEMWATKIFSLVNSNALIRQFTDYQDSQLKNFTIEKTYFETNQLYLEMLGDNHSKT